MKRIGQMLFFALLIAGSFSACSSKVAPKSSSNERIAPKWQQEVLSLNAAIENKTNQANLYRAKAARAKNQGDRLQFNSRDVTEAKRYWDLADYYNAQAALLEKEVQILEANRKEILKKENKGQSWPGPGSQDQNEEAPF
ncbi:MAG: hypothetical protein WDZ28_00780 [Simkaniaceae bacterium]